ncbi:MAG: electron transfer flavoprotein subunit beta/FixA family protein, partial [Desulfobulbales bacterium]
MNIIVCIKQVPDAKDVRLDPKTNTMAREGVESIMNPFDRHALEEAVRLKEQHGGTVTVVSMGPPQAETVLREAVACGADAAVLVSDRAFAGADTWATTYTLGKAIMKNGPFDLIVCGKQAIDGDTAQVGPGLAKRLDIPYV